MFTRFEKLTLTIAVTGPLLSILFYLKPVDPTHPAGWVSYSVSAPAWFAAVLIFSVGMLASVSTSWLSRRSKKATLPSPPPSGLNWAKPGVPSRVHHVSLPVKNLKRAKDFYCHFLETTPLEQYEEAGRVPRTAKQRPQFFDAQKREIKGYWLPLHDGRCLHLVENKGLDVKLAKERLSQVHAQNTHVAFYAPDFQCAVDRLKDQFGIVPGINYVSSGPRQAYFVDEDGNTIEITDDPDDANPIQFSAPMMLL